jgi:hypothetical protein
MTSFTNGPGLRTIAVVKGGYFDKQVISITDENERSLTKRAPLVDLELTDEGVFELLPDAENNRVLYVCGISGSGKSTYCAKYIEKYLDEYPDANFYVFSTLPEDPAIDYLDPEEFDLDELADNPVKIEEFPDYSIILFDDIDTISDKKIKENVYNIKDKILQTGRHRHLTIVCTSHLVNGNDRGTTRVMLNEATAIVFFPNSGSTYGINYYLKLYAGMSPTQRDIVLNGMPGRSVVLLKNYPQIVMSEKRCTLVKSLGKSKQKK